MEEHMKEFELEVKLKNGPITRLIRERYGSNAEFYRQHPKINSTSLLNYTAMKTSPYKFNGELKQTAMNLCEALNKLPHELWPDAVVDRVGRVNRTSVSLSQADAQQILTSTATPEQHLLQVETLEELYKCLNDREKDIVQRRANGETLDSIGNSHNIGRERVRNVASRAIRKMRVRAKHTQIIDYDKNPLSDIMNS